MMDERPIKIDHPADFGRVAVLAGGTSAESHISLKSGNAIWQALRARGVDAVLIDTVMGAAPLLQKLVNDSFDRAFIALHGRGGEDGLLQGALETLEIPYTGSGVLGCAISMDKVRCKMLWKGAALPTPDFCILDSIDACAQAVEKLGLPLVVKPAHEGSSLGISKVTTADQMEAAWQTALKFDEYVMAECWVEGNEYTATILEGEALPLIGISPRDGLYDYAAKYELDNTQFFCPCGLSAEIEAQLQVLAMKAFNSVAARGWGRVDFMLDEVGNPWLIEVNTVPGMTDHSLVPMAAKAVGIEFNDLVWRILEGATT